MINLTLNPVNAFDISLIIFNLPKSFMITLPKALDIYIYNLLMKKKKIYIYIYNIYIYKFIYDYFNLPKAFDIYGVMMLRNKHAVICCHFVYGCHFLFKSLALNKMYVEMFL